MTAPLEGLDEAEAQARLARAGPNILQQSGSKGMLQIVRGTLREPMFLFLLAAASLYLVLGNLAEGLFLVGGAIVSIGLVVIQELRSQRALEALQALAEPFARVIRGGVERRIAACDLVPGDIVLVAEGERVPLDGVLVGGDVLTVDESMLTGGVGSSRQSRRGYGTRNATGWRRRGAGHIPAVRRHIDRARSRHDQG